MPRRYEVDPQGPFVLADSDFSAISGFAITTAETLAGLTSSTLILGYFPGDIRRYGAVAGGAAGTNATAIQLALDVNKDIYIPNGTFAVNTTLFLNESQCVRFASRAAMIQANITAAIFAGKNPTTERRLGINIFSGTIDNTTRSNANGIGLDLLSCAMTKVYGTLIQNVATGVRNGGSSSLGAFYNDFFGVDILNTVDGINNGTVGNQITFHGGRIADCTNGTIDNDNTGNSYIAMAIETFTGTAHKSGVSTTCSFHRFVNSRIENLNTSAPYNTATGFQFGSGSATSFGCKIYAPQLVNVVNEYTIHAATTDTDIWGDQRLQVGGGSRIRSMLKVTVNRDIASLAAGAFRQEGPITVTGAAVGDSVFVTLPSAFPGNLMVGMCIITAANTVFMLLHNPSGGAVDPAALDYVFNVVKF